MKKLTLLVIISFLTLTAFKAPVALLGNWEVVKIKDNENKTRDKIIKWMSFKEGGVVAAGNDGVSATGIWSYNESDKTITVQIDGNPSTKFKIMKLSEKKLIIKNNESIIFLKKANKKP